MKIPDEIPLTSACLIACGVLTGVGAVFNTAKVEPGHTTVVFGVGGVGLNVIQALRIANAGSIIAIDTLPQKEALARQFGATHFIDATDTDAVEAVRDMYPFHPKMVKGPLGAGGVDVAFDCVGHTVILRQCVDMLDWGGKAIVVGVPGFTDEVSIPAVNFVQVDRTVTGSRGWRLAPAVRHPAVRQVVSRGKAHARRARHADVPGGRLQRRARRHGSRQARPRRAHLLVMPLPDWFHEAAARVNNWGRWGSDDEVGTVNLITPEVVRRAARVREVRPVVLVGMAAVVPREPPEGQLAGPFGAAHHDVHQRAHVRDPSLFTSSDDVVTLGLQAATHWDGLAHVSYDGRMYNGVPLSAVTAAGATRLGIHRIRSVVSRGVLLDVARTLGVDRLDGGYGVTPDDLDAAEAAAGIEVAAGDIVLVRTGQVQVLLGKRPDREGYAMSSSGLAWQCAEWFHARDVAAVAIDNLTFDPYPVQDPAAFFPAHLLHLVEMGMLQGQNWVLEELAADCAADGVYEFLSRPRRNRSPMPSARRSTRSPSSSPLPKIPPFYVRKAPLGGVLRT